MDSQRKMARSVVAFPAPSTLPQQPAAASSARTPFPTPFPAPLAAARSSTPPVHGSASALAGVMQPQPGAALISPTNAGSNGGSSGPGSGASSSFTSPFQSLSSSPRAASQVPPAGAAAALSGLGLGSSLSGAGFGNSSASAALANFPPPLFGSAAAAAQPGPATASSLSFPAPSFSLSSGGPASSSAVMSGFPSPFPAAGVFGSGSVSGTPLSGGSSVGAVSLGGSGMMSGVSSLPSSAMSSVAASHHGSFPPSRSGSSVTGSGNSSISSSHCPSPRSHTPNLRAEEHASATATAALARPHTAGEAGAGHGRTGSGAAAALPFASLPQSSASTPAGWGSGSPGSLTPFAFPLPHSVTHSTSVSPGATSPPSPHMQPQQPPQHQQLKRGAPLSSASSLSLMLPTSGPSSLHASPLPSPRIFAGGPSFGSGVGSSGSGGGLSAAASVTVPHVASTSSGSTALLFAKGLHTHAHAQPLQPATARSVAGAAGPTRSLSASNAVSALSSTTANSNAPTRSSSSHSALLQPHVTAQAAAVALALVRPARLPSFPATLRASSCSPVGLLLTPPNASTPSAAEALTPAQRPFIVAPPAPVAAAPPASAAEPSFAALLDSLTFSLSSLLLESGAEAGLAPFTFASASPDDECRARLQATGGLSRATVTDSSTLEEREGKQTTAAKKKQRKGRKQAQLHSSDDEEDDADALGSQFVHSGAAVRRRAIAARVGLSSGSVGASEAARLEAEGSTWAGSAAASQTSAAASLAADSAAVRRSRPFVALLKAVGSQKRAVLEELAAGARVAAALLQHRVCQPRERERRQDAETQKLDGPDASASSAATAAPAKAAASTAASTSASAVSAALEPWGSRASGHSAVQPSAAVIAAATAAAGAQLALIQRSMLAARLASAELALSLLSPAIDSSVRSHYEHKRAAFSAGRSLASVADPSAAALELRTPTAAPQWLVPLSSLRLLIVAAPCAGVSTLLGQLLYRQGRLPFALVNTRDAPPDYWECFNGQHQLAGPAVKAALASAASSASSSTPPEPASFVPPAVASFIAAHPRLHELNARRFNFAQHLHCLYTDRLKLQLMHAGTANMHSPSKLTPFKVGAASSNHSTAASAQVQAAAFAASSLLPSAQQSHVHVLSALQADALLLVVDGSAGSTLTPTPVMLQQLLIAQLRGVRSVLVCVTQLDRGASPFSQQRFQAVLASLTSGLLKPLGFAPQHIVSVPVSGRTGENLCARSSRELAWYTGPTLMQLLDRLQPPPQAQTDQAAERAVSAVVLESPQVEKSILNEDVVEALHLRVQVAAGTVLAGEPLCYAAASAFAQSGSGSGSRSSCLPIGPMHVGSVQREVREDARDVAVYEDDEDAIDAGSKGDASSSSSSSSAAPVVTAQTKHKVGTDGRKLTNAERRAAIAEEKKEHARLAAKAKGKGRGKDADWRQEEAAWLQAEATAEFAAEAEAEAAASSAVASAAVAAPLPAAVSASACLSVSLSPAPCLTEGDVGVLTLRAMPAPTSTSDDALSTLLTGRDMTEVAVSHSRAVLQAAAGKLRPGDVLLLPPSAEAATARFVTAFKAEVLALHSWPADMHVANGQAVTMIPLRAALPSPAEVSYASPASLLSLLMPPPARALPLGSVPVIIDRIVSILHKTTRAATRKKPDYLAGPPAPVAGAAINPVTSSADLSVVEFSCRPTVLDTVQAGGNRLGTFLIVHQETVIAVAAITHILESV